MNYNILSYTLYLVSLVAIILRVGHLFHKHGAVYLQGILKNDALTQSLNNLLLVGYYLLNLGMAIYYLGYWPTVSNLAQVLKSLSVKLGGICLLLALLHFFNLSWIYWLQKRNSTIN